MRGVSLIFHLSRIFINFKLISKNSASCLNLEECSPQIATPPRLPLLPSATQNESESLSYKIQPFAKRYPSDWQARSDAKMSSTIRIRQFWPNKLPCWSSRYPTPLKGEQSVTNREKSLRRMNETIFDTFTPDNKNCSKEMEMQV